MGFAWNPQAVAKDGVIYMYFPRAYFVVALKDGKATVLDGAVPEFADVDKYEFPMMSSNTQDDPFVGHGVLAVASDGIILVGPPAADGSSDTYILREGSTKFEPYEKRASEARAQSVAACTYRGRLFVIGSSWVEPNQRFFRATAMDVPEYPGDIPCDEKDEPTPDVKPTPNHGGQLPKTGDDTPSVAIVVVGAVGLLLVGGGITLRSRARSAR